MIPYVYKVWGFVFVFSLLIKLQIYSDLIIFHLNYFSVLGANPQYHSASSIFIYIFLGELIRTDSIT